MPYSGSPAARTSRPTTRSTTRASATSSAATSRGPATRPRATRRRPARSASRSAPPGPGATNLVTAIADAMLDSVPTVFLTGQVRTELIGTDGFQEADTIGITMPIVKHSFQVLDPREIPHMIHEAFHVARTGRPGPGAGRRPAGPLARGHPVRPLARPRRSTCPATRHFEEGNVKQIRLAAKALANAQAPDHLRGRRRRQRQRRPTSCASSSLTGPLPDHLHGDGAGRLPGAARAVARHARHARHAHRQLRDGQRRPDRRGRRPLRRPHHRQAVGVRAAREVRPHRHRPGRDLEERAGAHPDRRRLQADPAEADRRVPRARGRRRAASTSGGSRSAAWQEQWPLRLRALARRARSRRSAWSRRCTR